jgi:ribosomal protein S18 acetylase RimI-like enzyme
MMNLERRAAKISHERSAPKGQAEVFIPSPSSWEKVRSDIIQVRKETFPMLPSREERLQTDFQDPATTVSLLRTAKGEVVGYSYAVPIGEVTPKRERENTTTAYIKGTAIRPDFQNQGLLPPLLTNLDEQLREKGFIFVEQHARTANGYATTLEKVYDQRIVEVRGDYDEELQEKLRFLKFML